MEEVPHYCQINHEAWEALSPSALAFIRALDLPKLHPRCLIQSTGGVGEENNIDIMDIDIPIPDHEMDQEYFYESDMGLPSKLYTIFRQIAPALLAMGELWLRLFACIIAPLVVAYLTAKEIRPDDANGDANNKHQIHNVKSKKRERGIAVAMMVGLASSTVLFTDTLYCQAFGRSNGGILLCMLTFLSVRRCSTFCFYRLRFIFGMVALWCLTIYLYVHSQNGNGGSNDLMGHPGIDIATIQQGLYFSSDNVFMSRVAEVWPESERSYSYSRQRHSSSNSSTLPAASPFPTGDSLTGIPFLTNSAPELNYHRLWVQSEVDPEAVAIDIAFPPDGVHRSDKDKPVYLILHGLSGGSHEEYVRELAVRRTREGHTCIVMIARGMMDTPIFGWNIFHGARITDVDASAKAIRKALAPDQMLAGVGFSMGAIIISNYVARSGSDCHLDAAVAISGGLDMRENLNFRRSMRLWQPMLAQTLLEDFVKAKFDGRFRQRLTKEQHLYLMRASSVSEVDIHGIVTYNGFDSLNHYYSEMSAMGDTNMFQSKQVNVNKDVNDGIDNGTGKHGSSSKVGRIGNVSIPFCVVHARDDPLTTWRTMGHDPERLVRTGSGNIMMLLTDAGGHVGWPLGINPRAHGWRFMNDVAAGFINSVNTVRKTTMTDDEEQQQ